MKALDHDSSKKWVAMSHIYLLNLFELFFGSIIGRRKLTSTRPDGFAAGKNDYPKEDLLASKLGKPLSK